MDELRRGIAILLIVALPVIFLYWLLIHALVGLWRRAGLRRSYVVILLCLELMLSAGALAMIAMSRMLGDQDGQVFVLLVLVVAACEVVVGLGLVVAMFRRRLPLDVDEMKELKG